jgi:hypothetical protein
MQMSGLATTRDLALVEASTRGMLMPFLRPELYFSLLGWSRFVRRPGGIFDMNNFSATRSYFGRSPFYSLSFDLVTAVLVIFVLSEVRTMREQPSVLKTSDAIFGLMLLPVAVWILSLFLHWEIRALVEQTDETSHYPRIVQLHYSRLAGLHRGLILGVTIMSWGIIQALVRTMGTHH